MRQISIATGFFLLLTVAACTYELDGGIIWVPEDLTLADRAEGDTGLFMGRALSEPTTRELTHREYWTTKIEFRLTPDDFIPAKLSRRRLPFESGELEVVEVSGEQMPADAPLIVHCYGIGANLYNNGIQYALKTLPFGNSLHFDLPGHGKSDGHAAIADIDKATTALADDLITQAPDRPIVFWGHSLGGYVCADLARKFGRPDALVIEASALNGMVVAQRWVPYIFRPFVRVRPDDEIESFDMVSLLAGLDAPILVMGARSDDIIPEPLVRELATTLSERGFEVTYHAYPNAEHSTIAFAEEFADDVSQFLGQALSSKGARPAE